MNRIEDQLTSASEEARYHVAMTESRPVTGVRGRLQRQRVAMGTMVVAGVLGLSGLSAFIAQDPASLDAATGGSATEAAADDAVEPATEVSPTTTMISPASGAAITGEGYAFYTTEPLDDFWPWTTHVPMARAGDLPVIPLVGDEVPGLKMATVADEVPAIGNALVLALGSTEFHEDAFFILEDGSDTMVYIGWQDLQVHDKVAIELPPLDDLIAVGTQNGVLVGDRVLSHTVDFVADGGTEIATVRFFQLADTYASIPIESRADAMASIFDGVLKALAIPQTQSGALFATTDVETELVAAPTTTITAPVIAESPDGVVGYDMDASAYSSITGSAAFLGGGTSHGEDWAIVGGSLGSSTCSGVRPILNEDVCTTVDVLWPVIYPMGDAGILVLRPTQDAMTILVTFDDGETVEIAVVGPAEGYPAVAVIPVDYVGQSGTAISLDANGETIDTVPWEVTGFYEPAG